MHSTDCVQSPPRPLEDQPTRRGSLESSPSLPAFSTSSTQLEVVRLVTPPPPRRGKQLHPLYSLSEKQWWVNCSPAGGPPGGAVHSESSQSCTAHVLYIKASQPRLLLTYELPKKGSGGHLFQEAVMLRNLNSAETRVNHWVQDKALTFEGRLHRHLQQTESLTFTST